METYTVKAWVETTKPEPFGEPINGKQATISQGHYVEKQAVLVEDVIAFLKHWAPNYVEHFQLRLNSSNEMPKPTELGPPKERYTKTESTGRRYR